jgi:hypothetical protein
MKELKDYTFEELIDDRSADALSALLLKGGKGLKDSVGLTIDIAIRWYKETHDNT